MEITTTVDPEGEVDLGKELDGVGHRLALLLG